MNRNYAEEVESKTTDELKSISLNFHNYQGALISATKRELENRGVQFTSEEKQRIEELKNQKKQDAIIIKDNNNTMHIFMTKWKMNIVDDINVPQLYSRQVINVFSIIFSVLFGGILLSINLKKVNNKKAILAVLIFSVAYMGLLIFIQELISVNTTVLTVGFNALGAIVLYNFFWRKYIGQEFKYRTKPFWIPLIIGILIGTALVLAIISENQI